MVLVSGAQSSENLWNSLSGKRIKVSHIHNKPLATTSEATVGKLLRMRLVAREASHVVRELVLGGHPPAPWGRAEGLEKDVSHQGQ